MSNEKLKVAVIQQKCTSNSDENLNKTKVLLKKAKAGGAELVLLQELHTNLYFCQTQNVNNFELAETIPGKTTDFIAKVAKEEGLVIISSVFEIRTKGLYNNTAVVIDSNGSIAGISRKMHIPQDPGYEEKFYFSPSDNEFEPINTSVGCLGVLTCYDQWYPEAARILSLKGAEILLYPTAIGWDKNDSQEEQNRQLDSWITIQRSHGIANGIFVMSANRCGIEDNIDFWGNSFISGPQGEVLAHAKHQDEEVLIVEIDKNRTKEVRDIWPFFRDRRVDKYRDILKKYK